jgi:putative membrane protein (TIGR04086 family)
VVAVRKSDITEPGFKRYVVSVLIGSLAGLALCLVLLLPMSALILAGILDEGISGILLILVIFASSLFGGIMAVNKAKASPIPVGIAAGVLLFLVLCVMGLLLYEHFLPTENGLGLFLASAAGGLLGGRMASPGRGSSGSRRNKRK